MRSRLLILPIALGATLLAIYLQAPRPGQPSSGTVQATEGSPPPALAEGAPPPGAEHAPVAAGAPEPALVQPPLDLEPPVASADPGTPQEPAVPPADGAPLDGGPDAGAVPEPAPSLVARRSHLRVRVVEPTGAAVAGADLRLWAIAEEGPDSDPAAPSAPEQPLAMGVADGDGRTGFSDLPPGRYEVQLFSPGLRLGPEPFALHDPGASAALLLGPGETRELVLTAPPRARVHGVVELSGAPLEGARLLLVDTLTPGRPGAVREEQRTGADGSYRFSPVPAGRYRLRVEHPGLGSPSEQTVEWEAGEQALPLRFEPAELAGRVLSADGRPAAGALVWVERAGQPIPVGAAAGRLWIADSKDAAPRPAVVGDLPYAIADADGFFLLGAVDPSESSELWVLAEGCAPFRQPLELRPATTRRVDLRLTQGARLEVGLVDGDGQPQPGQWVSIEDPSGRTWSLPTDADGLAHFAALPPGVQRLSATPFGPSLPPRTMELAAGESARLVLEL